MSESPSSIGISPIDKSSWLVTKACKKRNLNRSSAERTARPHFCSTSHREVRNMVARPVSWRVRLHDVDGRRVARLSKPHRTPLAQDENRLRRPSRRDRSRSFRSDDIRARDHPSNSTMRDSNTSQPFFRERLCENGTSVLRSAERPTICPELSPARRLILRDAVATVGCPPRRILLADSSSVPSCHAHHPDHPKVVKDARSGPAGRRRVVDVLSSVGGPLSAGMAQRPARASALVMRKLERRIRRKDVQGRSLTTDSPSLARGAGDVASGAGASTDPGWQKEVDMRIEIGGTIEASIATWVTVAVIGVCETAPIWSAVCG